MSRLVVYVRSSFCPDVRRWRGWVSEHPLDYLEIDIDKDDDAYHRVLAWTGHESVPTLVIADDDSVEPIDEPDPLPERRGPRAVDRGTMLTEPNPGQIGPFLERHGIPYGGPGGTAPGENVDAPASEGSAAAQRHPWWKLG